MPLEPVEVSCTALPVVDVGVVGFGAVEVAPLDAVAEVAGTNLYPLDSPILSIWALSAAEYVVESTFPDGSTSL